MKQEYFDPFSVIQSSIHHIRVLSVEPYDCVWKKSKILLMLLAFKSPYVFYITTVCVSKSSLSSSLSGLRIDLLFVPLPPPDGEGWIIHTSSAAHTPALRERIMSCRMFQYKSLSLHIWFAVFNDTETTCEPGRAGGGEGYVSKVSCAVYTVVSDVYVM